MATFSKAICFRWFAFCMLMASTTSVSSANNPVPGNGDYYLTCSHISVLNDELHASCKDTTGSYQRTSLPNLDICVTSKGEIANSNGNLICYTALPIVAEGFQFPRSETEIKGWVSTGNKDALYRHSWGIWAGLTHVVANIDNEGIRAYQTWESARTIAKRTHPAGTHAERKKELEILLEVPRQQNNQRAIQDPHAMSDLSIAVGVQYNIPAAKHSLENRLFLESTLKFYLQQGYSDIPNFPKDAITLKPVYKTITADEITNNIYTFPGWPGPPDSPQTFGQSVWNACVYIDITKKGMSDANSVDQGCKNQSSKNTFFIDDFLHNKITDENKKKFNNLTGSALKAGDYVILVGMHAATREIKRWTWQTFWWSADPNSPYSPSSPEIAKHRTIVADAAARHYAMSNSYQMVEPVQPVHNGRSIGTSHLAYNPYLEAGFDEGVFQIVREITNTQPNKNDELITTNIINRFGVQTNCMSCHTNAQYNPNYDYNAFQSAQRQMPYSTNFYIGLSDSIYRDKLRLDFLWSILGNLK